MAITLHNAITDQLYAECDNLTPEGIYNVVRNANADLPVLSDAIEWWQDKEEIENKGLAKYCIFLETIKSIEALRLNALLTTMQVYLDREPELRNQIVREKEFGYLVTVSCRFCIKFSNLQEQMYRKIDEIGKKIYSKDLEKIYTAAWTKVLQSSIFSQQISLVMPDIEYSPLVVIIGDGLSPYFPDFAFKALCDGLITPYVKKITDVAIPPIKVNGAQLKLLKEALKGKEFENLYIGIAPEENEDILTPIKEIVKQCRVKTCNVKGLPDRYVQILLKDLGDLHCTLLRSQ